MKKNRRVISAAVCVLLIAAMLIPMLSAASVGSTAWAEESTVLYQNDVFTKRLYKTVAKIGFGSDGSMIVDDRQTIRKVYGLLAGMRLKAKNNTKKNTENEKKAAAVAVVLYKKDGSKKTYTFTGDLMRTGKKTYTIKKIIRPARSGRFLKHVPPARLLRQNILRWRSIRTRQIIQMQTEKLIMTLIPKRMTCGGKMPKAGGS